MRYEEEVAAIHDARVARLRSGTGWLSLVDKVFLGQGLTRLRLPDGSTTGDIFVEGRRVELAGKVLRSDAAGRGEPVTVNGFVLELMERGDTLALRIRDHRELPRPFGALSRFPVDPTWRKPARLVPHASPRELVLDFEGATGSGHVTDTFVSPGVLAFEHAGAEQRLEAVWEGAERKRLFVLFRDATSGTESYPTGRFLYAEPDLIDFNLAMLPGCAFTDHATCPLPPPGNRLLIPVRAGERFYEPYEAYETGHAGAR